jgi:hypothetical protein
MSLIDELGVVNSNYTQSLDTNTYKLVTIVSSRLSNSFAFLCGTNSNLTRGFVAIKNTPRYICVRGHTSARIARMHFIGTSSCFGDDRRI